MDQFQNGRVITTNEPMKDLGMIENNSTQKNFQEEALYGIQEQTQLNQLYFSKANMEIIQNKISTVLHFRAYTFIPISRS